MVQGRTWQGRSHISTDKKQRNMMPVPVFSPFLLFTLSEPPAYAGEAKSIVSAHALILAESGYGGRQNKLTKLVP